MAEKALWSPIDLYRKSLWSLRENALWSIVVLRIVVARKFTLWSHVQLYKGTYVYIRTVVDYSKLDNMLLHC